jgi:hypothetical protein
VLRIVRDFSIKLQQHLNLVAAGAMLSAAHPLVQSLSWLVEIPIHLNH